MNLIEKTFTDSVWYWAPSQATGANGSPVYATAVLLAPPKGGRWDENPATVIGAQGEQIKIGARFTTRFALSGSGWLLKQGDEDGKDPQTLPPGEFGKAREVGTVSVLRDFKRTVAYYVGGVF